jgi:glycerol-3-phosphate O-acyltransferase
VSQVLIRTALKIADNRGLLDPEKTDLEGRRGEFAEEIRTAIRRIDAIETLAASRRVGLID